jgi:hypothetical protein
MALLRGWFGAGQPGWSFPRRHVHERIERAELPVTHVTRRTGRPYTLVLTKTGALFTVERAARATAAADLR